MKTYILMLSKYFPVTHPRAGEPTFFRNKVMGAVLNDWNAWQKLHTIRANYPLWAKRIEEVQRGLAVISLRQWSGKPYHSKMLEITKIDYHENVGIQKLTFDKDRDGMVSWNFFDIDGKYPSLEDVAHNDGLVLEDWKAWFRNFDFTKPMAVIHFTKFRY